MYSLKSILAALACAAALFSATSAKAQVVVYTLDFKHESGFNVDFFNGGYFVADALGGTGTFILTAISDGRRVLFESAGSGQFFVGIDNHGTRFGVVSAQSGVGNSTNSTLNTSWVAFGEVNKIIDINTPTADIRLKVAAVMRGTAVAAGDETDDAATTRDRDIGFANISSIKLTLDERQTKLANKRGQSVSETSEALSTLLQQKGYVLDSDTDTDTDSDS